MRLYTFIKISGNLTKSEVNSLSKLGKIKVNGNIMPLTTIINDSDIITIDDKIINKINNKYYLYYKPRGVLSTISKSKNSYVNVLNLDIKLSLAGRLDKESEGLMILTNDGSFINELMKPGLHSKEYIVTLKYKTTNEFINNISKEYILNGRKTTPFIVKKIDDYTVNLTLFEGVYHQIRKIVSMNNNVVMNLKRIRIKDFYLEDMKPGEIKEFKKGN